MQKRAIKDLLWYYEYIYFFYSRGIYKYIDFANFLEYALIKRKEI